MTPEHIIQDIGRKLADDVTAAAHRNMKLVDDAHAAFVVATYGASSAVAAAAGSFAAYDPNVTAEKAADAIWAILRPMVVSAIEQVPA